MMTEISPRMLSHLSTQIATGRPLWAILSANEYLDAQDALRIALATKAKSAINETSYSITSPLIEEVLGGKKLSELNESQRRELTSFRELGENKRRTLPTPKRRGSSLAVCRKQGALRSRSYI